MEFDSNFVHFNMEMEKQYNTILEYKEQLENTTELNKVMEIARNLFFMKIDIDFNFRKFIESCDAMKEINSLLIKFLLVGKSLIFHKCVAKAVVKLAVHSMNECYAQMDTAYMTEFGDFPVTALMLHAFLENQSIVKFPYNSSAFHGCFVQCSLKYSSDTKYFSLAIENYTRAYDDGLIAKNDSFTITVICTNLENGHQHVHKPLLDLFSRVVRAANRSDEQEIMEILMDDFTWHNRNKHYLLSRLISVRPEMLFGHKDYDVRRFLDGLRIGLSQYHLYSSSLTLVKVICEKSEFRSSLIELSADILLNGFDYEVQNFLKLWFTAYDDKFKDELLAIVLKKCDFSQVSSTSLFFYRALVIRNAFDKVLSAPLENSIREFCCSFEEVRIKIEVYNYLIDQVFKPTAPLMETLECILRLLKFLQCNMRVEDSLFIDTVMRKLPNFFNHLATNRFRNVDICKEIFTVIRCDLYEHGVEFGSYETCIFSLRLLEVLLKQYCGVTKGRRRLCKKTDESINQKFKQYLKDNGIWDITSNEIFQQLVSMTNDRENSDICTAANEILVEYFIKAQNVDGVPFTSWIDLRVHELFSSTDVESYHENISYWKMKFEHLGEGVMEAINDLNLRSDELSISKDPVSAMERGRSLFILIDCINYSISRMESIEAVKIIVPTMTSLMKTIALQFLDFTNDGVSGPSFDVLDHNLRQLVENSSNKCENVSEMRNKLMLSVFFTLRAISELSTNLAKVMNETTNAKESEHFSTLSTCIDVNIQILSRSCHKGVIEAASSALGFITKLVSTQFQLQCNRSSTASRNLQTMLITLKHEIDCGKRHSSKTGEIRGSRGFLLMSHCIIRNHSPFLKFLMQRLLVTKEIKAFHDTQDIQFASDVQPIHLHLLAVLIKDSELMEEMLKYYDFILLATFKAYKETRDFVIQNALLQIIGSVTPKIGNHKRHAIDETDAPQYEAKAISVYEFYVKLTYAYRIALVDLETHTTTLPQTYIIILLDIFSNFENRKPCEYSSEMDRLPACFRQLMSHRCEKIRVLAAKCYAQWHLPRELPAIVDEEIDCIFSHDPNAAHGSIVAVRHMLQRYEASVKFIVKEFDKEKFLKKNRAAMVRSWLQSSHSAVMSNFHLKYHFHELLLFLGFISDNEIVKALMDDRNATSKIGYSLWREKIMAHQMKALD